MKHFRKKPLVITLIAIAAAVGITSGIVSAQDKDAPQPEAQHEALLERVCEIYEANTGVAIEPEALKDAFAAAQGEMMAEAMENHLDKLVEEGVITQEEADQFKEWWQARPDTPLSRGPMFRDGPGGSGGFNGPGGPRQDGFGAPRGQGQPEGATETSFTY
ncbi:MAG: hypothetical protein JW790_00060 [Dehalococcoidales bacterium]|nr:hypothetical protein [Dehalococcoidales bacterium]